MEFEVDARSGREIAGSRRVRPTPVIRDFDEIGNQDDEIQIVLTVTAQVDLDAVYGNGEIGAAIEIEAADEIMVRLSRARGGLKSEGDRRLRRQSRRIRCVSRGIFHPSDGIRCFSRGIVYRLGQFFLGPVRAMQRLGTGAGRPELRGKRAGRCGVCRSCDKPSGPPREPVLLVPQTPSTGSAGQSGRGSLAAGCRECGTIPALVS